MSLNLLIIFFRELLKLFMCKELINFDALCKIYGKELLNLDVFNQTTTHGKKCYDELKSRLIEHVSICKWICCEL